jgi:hypothetical protein
MAFFSIFIYRTVDIFKYIKYQEKSKLIYIHIIIVCFITILLSSYIAPLIETDSMTWISDLLLVMDMKRSIFNVSWHYPFLWECIYMPSITLTGTSMYLMYPTLQIVIAFSIATFVLARQLDVDNNTAFLLALLVIFLGHCWGPAPTGIGTTKNDQLVAVGFILSMNSIVYFIHKKRSDRMFMFMLTIGSIFITDKWNGPVLLFIAFILFVILFYKNDIKKFHINYRSIFLSMSIIIFSTGIYYFASLFYFGNPVYPMRLSFGPWNLNGTHQVIGTRLSDYLSNIDTWLYFFGLKTTGYEMGFFYPFFMILFILLIIPILVKYYKDKSIDKTLIFMWLWIILSFILFLFTPNSSGFTAERPYEYIRTGNILRYILGPYQCALVLCLIFIQKYIPKLKYPMIMMLFIELCARILIRFYEHYNLYKGADFDNLFMWGFLSILFIISFVLIKRYNVNLFCFIIYLLSLFLVPTTYANNKKLPLRSHGVMAIDDLGHITGYPEIKTLYHDKFVTQEMIKMTPRRHGAAASGEYFRLKYTGDISFSMLEKARQYNLPTPEYIGIFTPAIKISDQSIDILNELFSKYKYSKVAHRSYSIIYKRE